MKNLFTLILCLFLFNCGTKVPVTKKVTKIENIQGQEVKVYLNEKAEKISNKLFYLDISDSYSFQFKVREHFKVPEAITREDIAKKYITEKKQATMVHNPWGEGTGSLFAFGMIEAWCLTEWLGTALPGKQKEVYLSKCKERYVGSKKKYTEEEKTVKILSQTGNFKDRYQDSSLSVLFYELSNLPNMKFPIEAKINPICSNEKYKVFNCGKTFETTLDDVVKNYAKHVEQSKIDLPIVIKIKAEGMKNKITKSIELPKTKTVESIKIALLKIEEEKKALAASEKLKRIEAENLAKKKELELKEKYKPVAAWNGSAFFVSNKGHIITNNHVVEDTSIKEMGSKCDVVEVHLGAKKYKAKILSQDRQNDLALLQIENNEIIRDFASFRKSSPVLGEKIIAMGYPFGKLISSQIKLNTGNVSSLSGLGDEFTRMQIDAALQPGNSGGPIYDKYGNVVGVAVAKASIEFFLKAFGTLPENMNFGIKPSVVKTFLESNNVKFKIGNYRRELNTEKIASLGSKQTLYLECLIRKDKLAKINKIKKKLK